MKADTEIVIWILIFFFGMSIGVAGEQKIITMWSLPEWFYVSIATLAAAFSGAWFAYLLERRRAKEKQASERLLGVNRVLFSLTEMINSVLNINKQFVDPIRSSPMKYLEMQPTLPLDPLQFNFDVSLVDFFLISKHSPMMIDLSVVNERYATAIAALNERSRLHLEVVQPALASAGVPSAAALSDSAVRGMLDPALYAHIVRSTDDVIEALDETRDLLKLRFQDLRSAALDELGDLRVASFEHV